ncbi:MAG TPA: ATP-binding protein [Solirubrobacteraceae bacterium]|nr:ATP-binding protein [Solirubrobacteraceae bacterium]
MAASAADPYLGSDEHLADELSWLDGLLSLRTAAFRERLRAAPASKPAYVSHEEVDWLLAGGAGDPAPAPDEVERLRRDVAAFAERVEARVRSSAEAGIELSLPQLQLRFGLSPLERRAVVVCLAPELDRKYDKLYAYLQDDIARRRPSVDLVLELLCEDPAQRRAGRALFTRQGRLLRAGVLEEVPDPESPSGATDLARFLRLDARVLGFLLGDDRLDARLAHVAELDARAGEPGPATGAEDVERVTRAIERRPRRGEPLVVHLHGPAGVGRLRLARAVCERLGRRLLAVDVPSLLRRGPDAERLLRLAFREAVLARAVVLLRDAEPLLEDEHRAELSAVARAAAEHRAVVFLATERAGNRPPGLGAVPLHRVELPLPGAAGRAVAWSESLAAHRAPDAWAGDLAGRFRLTPGRIRAAVDSAALERAARGDDGPPALADLARAARRESRHRLGELAVHVEPRASWDDLVLPPDRLAQLREICGQVRHRDAVLDGWGFGRRVGRARGVSALFSGPPGTGKTLAIEVIARDLALDLYKVDLSGVVSKYVGETEKNLARVFDEAEAADAILFFDEADALFGKRTKVSDAHDRYANIETSYLLERMERHGGVVALATNLRENMDEAFTRRMRFVVDFPFPDEASRRRIWAGHLPDEAPVGPDVDLDELARELKIAGGSIRNIVLNAAFLAAADGGRIDMAHVVHATRRELEKVGRQWAGAPAATPVAGAAPGPPGAGAAR